MNKINILVFLFLILPLPTLCQYQNQQQQRYQNTPYQQQQQPQQGQYGQQQYNQQRNQYGSQQQPQQQQQQPQNGQFQQSGYQQQQYQQNQYNQNSRTLNGQQNGIRIGQQGAQSSGKALAMNSPQKLASSSNSPINGAQVDIRLTSYTNGDLSLGNITTCRCPATASCDYLAINQKNSCSFSFTIVISAKDQSVQYVPSDFYPFEGQLSTGNWTQPYTFYMPSKPVAIDVFVQHLGVVIEKLTGTLLYFGHLTLVDSFVVDLTNYNPVLNSNQQTFTLTGLNQKTQLQLTLAVQCINGMMGEQCDLSCPVYQANQDYVICTDSNGRNASCRWNGYRNQVAECVICTSVSGNGTCGAVIQQTNIGVSSAFRTWTIVLGCLLGLAVLFILCLIISFIIVKSRESREREDAAYNSAYQKEYKSKDKGGVTQPLVGDDEWSTAPRRTTTQAHQTVLQDSFETYSPRGNSTSRQEHQV